MKKASILTVAVAILSAMAISAYAVQSGAEPGKGFDKKCGIAKHLNLSEEQLTKMKELRNRHDAETRDLRYSLAVKRIEMRKLFTDPKTDEATLLAKQRELSKLCQQLMDKKAQMKIEWRSILTPEQIAKLDKMPHRWRAKGRGHHRD